MPTRTIPTAFPFMCQAEALTYKLDKAALIRRMAQGQNYLWSKLRRTYGNFAYEGNGFKAENMDTAAPVALRGQELMPDGTLGLLLSSFYCPRNWAGGTRLKVQGSYTLGGSGTGELYCFLYDLDGRYVGVGGSAKLATAGADQGWSVTLRVPQDKDYQVRVFLFTALSTNVERYSHTVAVHHISARYLEPDTLDSMGASVPDEWQPHYTPAEAFWPQASAFYKRIADNLLHLWGYRGPEVCQTSLETPHHNTSTFTRVGRYIVYTPHRVSHFRGKLLVYCTHGGAGNEVRVLLNGVQVAAWAALSAGQSTLDMADVALTDKQENTITIEAKSTAANADWGTCVWGVSFWESAFDSSGADTPPTAYEPLDEAALRGDKPIVWKNDKLGRRAGIHYLFQNDRWLAANRLRGLIGDWRHRVYKRLEYSPPLSNDFDPRVDWTRGNQWPHQDGMPKNITVNGKTNTENDKDGYGLFPYGKTGVYTGYVDGTQVGNQYTYPSSMTHTYHGRRVGWFWFGMPTGYHFHIDEPGALFSIVVRARRLRPFVLCNDSLGYSPMEQEPNFRNRAYLVPTLNTNPLTNIQIRDRTLEDWQPQWHPPLVELHDGSSGFFLSLNGRLPPASVSAPNPPYPEGNLFEIELQSAFVCDEPLSQAILASL